MHTTMHTHTPDQSNQSDQSHQSPALAGLPPVEHWSHAASQAGFVQLTSAYAIPHELEWLRRTLADFTSTRTPVRLVRGLPHGQQAKNPAVQHWVEVWIPRSHIQPPQSSDNSVGPDGSAQ